MKSNFSQPFEQPAVIDASLFIEVPDSHFVLAKVDEELTKDEYLPLRLEIDSAKEPVLQIAKHLYSKGLILSHLRELVTEQSVEFSFIDDTPGTLYEQVCYYVHADISQEHEGLIYVPITDLEEHVHNASFAEGIELSGMNVLFNHLTHSA